MHWTGGPRRIAGYLNTLSTPGGTHVTARRAGLRAMLLAAGREPSAARHIRDVVIEDR